MRPDGSLVIPNSSTVHSGMYYCLLQDAKGAVLWPYELHVSHHHHLSQILGDCQQSLSSTRFSWDIVFEKQKDVSHEAFAGAVTACVLLMFVFGFSMGALSRTLILRFLEFVTKRLQSSHQQTNVVELSFTSQGFEMGNLQNESSSTDTSSPPIKPQRSFRHKKEEERKTEEEEAGKSVEGNKKPCEEEQREGTENPNETEYRESTKEKDGGQSQEDNKSNEDRGIEKEKKTDHAETTKTAEDSQQPVTESGDSESQDGSIREASLPARRCRIIRLYQYDEDGQRYCHLPETLHEPAPTPRPRQRTRSLTRLSAIMAAATQEAGGEEGTRFHMDSRTAAMM
ncbi:uncharacterized protein LOC114867503 isoform X2 [Betta splendens]|nr:uncharacterized protein LOC114867503 isoform X2 [Betta splendens]